MCVVSCWSFYFLPCSCFAIFLSFILLIGAFVYFCGDLFLTYYCFRSLALHQFYNLFVVILVFFYLLIFSSHGFHYWLCYVFDIYFRKWLSIPVTFVVCVQLLLVVFVLFGCCIILLLYQSSFVFLGYVYFLAHQKKQISKETHLQKISLQVFSPRDLSYHSFLPCRTRTGQPT